jgi:hypothetical protein
MAAAAAMTISCQKGGDPGPDPGPVGSERIVLTQAQGSFIVGNSNPAADYVELRFTAEGKTLTIPAFTKPAVTGTRTLSSGVYKPMTGEGEVPFAFIPGNETAETGARFVSRGEDGEEQTLWITAGSFSVTRSGETYTIAFDMSEEAAAEEETATAFDLEADFTGPLAIADQTEYTTLDICAAGYFDDNYNVGTYYWQFEVYRNDAASGLQEGLKMFLNMSTAYHFDTGRFQEGDYTPATDYSALTFVQGQIDGNDAVGSNALLISEGKVVPYVVSDGTFTLESNGDGTHSILANVVLDNPVYGPVRKVFKFDGTIRKENKAYKNRTWNGVFTTAAATYWGPTTNNSDRWVMELSWPDEANPAESRVYIVEVYGPAGGGKTALPTGTFSMAAQTEKYVAGTIEPGWLDMSKNKKGTWMTSRMGNGERANPSPATPGKGSVTITSKGGGKYDFAVNFEEDARKNKFNGTGSNLSAPITDNGPKDIVITDWNNSSLLNYNGVRSGGTSNAMMVALTSGTLNFDGVSPGGITGILQGTGTWIQLDLRVSTDATRYIPLGVYNWAMSSNPFTFGGMSWSEYWDDNNMSAKKSRDIVGGTANVKARTGDNYTIEYDFRLYDGSTARGTFTGDLRYIDNSANQ